MSFLNAALLWGLPLLSVPIIIHLFNRRRRDVVHWGAMQFLIEAATKRRRIWRVSDLLLMLLRALAVAAFIFAIAQPQIQSSWIGPHPPRDVVLVVDTTLSTAVTESSGMVIDDIIDKSQQILNDLDEKDFVRVLIAANPPHWLREAAVPATADVRRQIKKELAALEPALASADMIRVVQDAVDAERASNEAVRTVTIVTDGQVVGWRTESPRLWGKLKDELAEMSGNTILNVVTPGDTSRAPVNLSIDRITAARTIARTGEPLLLTAEVTNTGERPIPSGLLMWNEDGQYTGSSSLPELAPGETTTVEYEHALESAGVHSLTCNTDAHDDLPPDSEDEIVLEAVEKLPILIVDNDRPGRTAASPSGYIRMALGDTEEDNEKPQGAVFQTDIISPRQLADQDLDAYAAVVVTRFEGIDEDGIDSLERFVDGGGGLWILPGEDVDVERFNDLWHRDGTGLCALALDNAVGNIYDDEHYEIVAPPGFEHPATRLLADTERLDTDKIRVYRRYRFKDVDTRPELQPLLITSLADPLAFEASYGEGRVITMAIPLVPGWSNLPLRQAHVVLVHEFLWRIAEPAVTDRNLTPGEVFALTLPAEENIDEVEVVPPDGKPISVPPHISGKVTQIRFSRTLEPGSYEVLLLNNRKTIRKDRFHVMRDPEESQLALLEPEQRKTLTDTGGIQFVASGLEGSTSISGTATPEPFWHWILIALLILFIAEALMAGRLTSRRFAPVQPVSMQPERASSAQMARGDQTHAR